MLEAAARRNRGPEHGSSMCRDPLMISTLEPALDPLMKVSLEVATLLLHRRIWPLMPLIASDRASEAFNFAGFSVKVSGPTKRHAYTPMTQHLLNELNEMAEDRKGAEQENK